MLWLLPLLVLTFGLLTADSAGSSRSSSDSEGSSGSDQTGSSCETESGQKDGTCSNNQGNQVPSPALDLHPSWRLGGGCVPYAWAGGDLWWDDLVDISVLPKAAKVFVCYDGRKELPTERSSRTVDHGGVLLVENFLTRKEVRHLRRLAQNWTAAADAQEAGERIAYGVAAPFQPNFDLVAAQAQHAATFEAFGQKVVNEVEQRVAAFLQIPASLYENYLQFMLVEPSAGRPALHHDKNHALVRRATALVYLNGGSEAGLVGGESLFPAVPRGKASVARRGLVLRRGPGHQRRERVLKAAVDATMKKLDPDDAWPELHLDESSGDAVHSEVMELCAAASSQNEFFGVDKEGPLLAIAPVPGRAVFWWHEGRLFNSSKEAPQDGQLIPEMWHVGCPVRSGEKLALQKFKNFGPEDDTCQRLQWCSEGWRRILKQARETAA